MEFKTKVKVDVETLRQIVVKYREDYSIAATGSNKSRLSNSKAFLEKVDGFEPTRTFSVVSKATGNTLRLYNTPSVTSLPAEVRKAIIPVKDGNRFLFFDVKSAEYMFYAFKAGATDIIDRYNNGGDVYQVSSRLLKTIPRDELKTVMISSLYGCTAFSASKTLGCSENQAEQVLEEISHVHPKITDLMGWIVNQSYKEKAYFYEKGMNSEERVYIEPNSPKYGTQVVRSGALSAFGQSGFAYVMNNALSEINRPETMTTLPIFDAIVMEVSDENDAVRLKSELKRLFNPFILEFREGSTFYEAYSKQ